MAISLTVNGIVYFYPETDDVQWGAEATDWANAVTTGMLQKSGGLFQLLADVDFGSAFGVKSLYYKTRTANPSTAGGVRLAISDTISWRNTANDGNLALAVNGSDNLTFNGAALQLAALTDGNIFVGNVSNVATSVAMSGDITISNAGVTAIGSNKVTLAQMAQMATASFLGRTTASTGNVEVLSATQATAMLDDMVGDSGAGGTAGLVPAPAAGDAAANKFLKADGTWVANAGGDVTGPASSTDNAIARFDSTTGKILLNSAATVADNGGVATTVTTANTAGGIILTQTFAPNPGSYGFYLSAASSGTGGGGTYVGSNLEITDSSGSDIFGYGTTIAHSGTNTANVYSFFSALSNSSAGASFYSYYAASPGASNATNYAGLLIEGVSSGTVSGFNDAIRVAAGRSYFGGTVNINGLTASVPVVTDASKNLVSLSYANFTAALSDMVGDAGAGGTKGLAPAPGAGDAAAGKFLKADGTWATPTGAGDVVGPASSVDGEAVLFDGTTGKLLKSFTGSGAVSAVSGVLSAGTLSIANGGTNKALTLAAGGLIWSDADSFEVGAAGTASDWALSGGTGAPTFSSTTTTAKIIDGSADAVQLTVEGHSTQTSDILLVQKSDSTDLLNVTNVNGTKIRGTTTNDAAAAGFVGEYIESVQTSLVSTTATNVWRDITSITLTPGDWDICGSWWTEVSGATLTALALGIGTAAGDSSAGMTQGQSWHMGPLPTTASDRSYSSAPYRVSISSNTTYYLKFRGTYTVSDIDGKGSIMARRWR